MRPSAQTILVVPDDQAGDADARALTLDQAREAVAGLVAEDPGSRVDVLLDAGRYRRLAPWVITPGDCPGDHGLIRWAARGDGEVIITGAVAVEGSWSVHHQSIMKTRLSVGLDVDQLFVDGRRATLARYPNEVRGEPLDGWAADAIEPERLAGWADPTTALVRGLHANEWGGNSYRALGRGADGSLELDWVGDNQRGSGLHPRFRMVENVFEELDAEDEWFYDRHTGWLYYWPPPDVDLATATVELAALDELIVLSGDTERHPVKNLVFEGLTVTGTRRTLFTAAYEPLQLGDWSIARRAAMRITDGRDIELRALRFDQVGGNGVLIERYAERVTVEDSTFAGSGATDIAIVGSPEAVRDRSVWGHEVRALTDTEPGPRGEAYPRSIVVRRNHLHHMGRFEKQSAGVHISMARRVTVEHNTIHDGPRAGININDGTWGGHRLIGNDIASMVLETGDHGPINSWGRDRYWPLDDVDDAERRRLSELDALEVTIIQGNRIWHDREWAIDLDDGSSRYLITDNLLINAGVKLREGFHRTVRTNVFVNGGVHAHVSYADNGDSVTQNLFLTRQPYFMIRADPAHSGIVYDHNWFFDDGRAIEQVGGSWRASGHDQHSQTGDPGIVGDPLWTRAVVDAIQLKPDAGPLTLGLAGRVAENAGAPGIELDLPPVDWRRGTDDDGPADDAVTDVAGARVRGLTSIALASSVGLHLGQGGAYVDAVSATTLAAARHGKSTRVRVWRDQGPIDLLFGGSGPSKI